jgi:hypothetical protein
MTVVQGTAEAWTATLAAPFGSLKVEGRGGFGGKTVAGTLFMGNEQMGFEGAVQ